MSEERVRVSVEEDLWKRFREVVGDINGGVNAFQVDEIALDPITKGKVFDVNVLCPSGRFLCVAHRQASVVVLRSDSGGFLWDVEIP